VTKTVGPAPTLAPGVLGQAALLVLLAGIGRRPVSRASNATTSTATRP
jgi:hypothetical protein